MFLDADAELEEIDTERRHETLVLALRMRVYQELERWELMLAAARVLVRRNPQNGSWAMAWANATRHAVSLDSARLGLLEAVERIPANAGVHYNLACCECLLGHVEAARVWLKQAFELDASLKAKALEDEDLAAVWK